MNNTTWRRERRGFLQINGDSHQNNILRPSTDTDTDNNATHFINTDTLFSRTCTMRYVPLPRNARAPDEQNALAPAQLQVSRTLQTSLSFKQISTRCHYETITTSGFQFLFNISACSYCASFGVPHAFTSQNRQRITLPKNHNIFKFNNIIHIIF